MYLQRCWVVTWLVPHETAAVLARYASTIMSCKATCIGCMHNVYCNLPPELLANWLGSFTCYRSNMREERILKSVSTESWPWRRKLSCHSSWDSNPKPFNHESRALTTELSTLPVHQSACKCLLHTTFTNPKQNTCTHSHTQKMYIYIYIYRLYANNTQGASEATDWSSLSQVNEETACTHAHKYIYTHHYTLRSSRKLLWLKLYMHEITLQNQEEDLVLFFNAQSTMTVTLGQKFQNWRTRKSIRAQKTAHVDFVAGSLGLVLFQIVRTFYTRSLINSTSLTTRTSFCS